MGRKSYENFGSLAEQTQDCTVLAGRYSEQKGSEHYIIRDVLTKLDLLPEHRLLDIGCNAGKLTIPLSFMVAATTGVDHPKCLRRLQEECRTDIELVPGNFLDLEFDRTFDRILCYSVIQYLRDSVELLRFLDKIADLLGPSGKALCGDIPNVSLKRRFLASPGGQEFSRHWELIRQANSTEQNEQFVLKKDPELVTIDDGLLMSLLARYRLRGFHTYVLPQQPILPFGYTREDLLIVRPT